ncbi:hypothetical protein B4N89_46025 [Embleya scabrispora]|uniref:Helicase n=1 Tax=Embleya scabrispora TaxID=159449 RepID=A0A1T3NJ40_9ACTN|nr:AAA family ATPase [Embleya scabrispora]OPC76833.1 hypothetical protein B4N89_46025 [Embleya scabrispora]
MLINVSPSGEPAGAVGEPPPSTPVIPQSEPATLLRPWAGYELLDVPHTARALQAIWSGDPATVVRSPPGAGKTRFVSLAAAALGTRAGLRVGLAAQTRMQAIELATRVAALTDRVVLVWKQDDPETPRIPGLRVVTARHVTSRFRNGGVIVATAESWMYRNADAMACDVMMIDEAWQMSAAKLEPLGAFAQQIVCVGDPGQIPPMVTAQIPARWERDPHAPHLPSPEVLMRKFPEVTTVVDLPHTWRLGSDTTALIQPVFYPQQPFTSRRPPTAVRRPDGEALPEVVRRTVSASAGRADPRATAAVARRVDELLDGHVLEREGHPTRPLEASDIAVVCPHVIQSSAVRALLEAHPGVVVGTANQLQGSERPATVVLHPLIGHRGIGPFATDLGRACVLLTRHSAHLTIVTDPAIEDVLFAAPAGTPGAVEHLRLLERLSLLPQV